MKLELTSRARTERNIILADIVRHSHSGAARFLRAIDETCRLICEHPEIGHRTRRPTVRAISVARYPYRIFYGIVGQTVSVLHIRHAARRPWLG